MNKQLNLDKVGPSKVTLIKVQPLQQQPSLKAKHDENKNTKSLSSMRRKQFSKNQLVSQSIDENFKAEVFEGYTGID